MKSPQTNWHDAINCAIQIDLKEYSHLLEYIPEHILSSNKNRIDLLVIRKRLDIPIPKNIASIFRTHNIFEHKGLHSSLTSDNYYKTHGHAGYYISSYPKKNALDCEDITLSFLTFHYPRRLFKRLTKECKKTIENPFPGVYYILKETYATQVLVIKELDPKEALYLYCLKKDLDDRDLINSLAKDYALNKNDSLYTKYMNQFIKSHRKGDQLMVCEELFKLYGTSSEEIEAKGAERARAQYLPLIEKQALEISQLTSKLDKLEQLLAQHNISY